MSTKLVEPDFPVILLSHDSCIAVFARQPARRLLSETIQSIELSFISAGCPNYQIAKAVLAERKG